MRSITHRDKNGKIIEDISKVKIPIELSRDVFEILNPGLKAIIPVEEKGNKKS